MIATLKKVLGLAPADPGAVAGKDRSPHWEAFSANFLKGKTCAACGTKKGLESHHCKPYHLFPTLELDATNLLALCRDHHLWLGHAGDWSAYNSEVREDAAHFRAMVAGRKYT